MKLNPEFVWAFFRSNPIPYNSRNVNNCVLPPAQSYHYGINSVQCRGSFLWNNLHRTVKETVSVKEFQQKLNKISSK